MSLKLFLSLALITLTTVTHSLAAIVTFEDLNTDLTVANTLTAVGGNNAGLTVTGVNNAAAGIVYSVTYTDNFGGSIGNQTLTYDMLVTAVSDSSITWGGTGATTQVNGTNTASAVTLGTTATDITINNDNGITWRPTSGAGGGARFDEGDSLIFQIQNATITGGFTVNTLGFTNAFIDESTGQDHRIIVGSGSNLYGQHFDGNLVTGNQANFQAISPVTPLIISSDNTARTNNINFGVLDVDFQLEIIPEPMTAGLIGAILFLFILFHRVRRDLALS